MENEHLNLIFAVIAAFKKVKKKKETDERKLHYFMLIRKQIKIKSR